MNISSVSVFNSSATSATSTTAAPADGALQDDGQQVHRRHGHHPGGGGQMMQAVEQALQSLGLQPPQKPTGTTATDGSDTTTTAATSDATQAADSTGTAPTNGDLRKDMHDFMHALFEAVKNDSNSDTGTGGDGSGSDPKANFAASLAALVTQASNGKAPSELQDAFAKLQADLQTAGADTAANSSSTEDTISASTAQATLQAFLTQLQQNLGYGGANSGLTATGNVVNTLA